MELISLGVECRNSNLRQLPDGSSHGCPSHGSGTGGKSKEAPRKESKSLFLFLYFTRGKSESKTAPASSPLGCIPRK